MDLAKLREPFQLQDIQWRIGRFGTNEKGPWAMVLAYVDNRAIMDRLDSVCGPGNWANEFMTGPSGGVLCGIRILIPADDSGRAAGWVTKWDGAENSDIEPIKGGLSDSMKRAAVHWGIGRYLYNLEGGWATFFERKDLARYTHYDKDAKKSYYWSPPALPEWAVPESTQEPPKPATKPNPNANPPAADARTPYQRLRDEISTEPSIDRLEEWRAKLQKSDKYALEEKAELELKIDARIQAVSEPALRH